MIILIILAPRRGPGVRGGSQGGGAGKLVHHFLGDATNPTRGFSAVLSHLGQFWKILTNFGRFLAILRNFRVFSAILSHLYVYISFKIDEKYETNDGVESGISF